MYSKSFGKIGLSLLQNLAKNDYEIDYKKFSYKLQFSEENNVRFHKIDFSKKQWYDFLNKAKQILYSSK